MSLFSLSTPPPPSFLRFNLALSAFSAQCEAESPAPENAHSGDAVEATTEDNNANEDASEEEEASGADDEEEEEPEDVSLLVTWRVSSA